MPVTKFISDSSLVIINTAIQAEIEAFYMYKHLANQCQRLGLFGAAKYFQNESNSELEHYQKHADFLNDRGSVAMLPNVEAMDSTIEGLKDALTTALAAETDLSTRYNNWYSQAFDSKDMVTAQHLLQFIEIQSKSIGEYSDWLQRLAIGGGFSVILIDQEMGA